MSTTCPTHRRQRQAANCWRATVDRVLRAFEKFTKTLSTTAAERSANVRPRHALSSQARGLFYHLKSGSRLQASVRSKAVVDAELHRLDGLLNVNPWHDFGHTSNRPGQ